MNKLKPYPFCGSEESEWIEHSPDCYLYKIVRQVESGCTAFCKESCEESWNTRFAEDKQAEIEKENEKLKKAINHFIDLAAADGQRVEGKWFYEVIVSADMCVELERALEESEE